MLFSDHNRMLIVQLSDFFSLKESQFELHLQRDTCASFANSLQGERLCQEHHGQCHSLGRWFGLYEWRSRARHKQTGMDSFLHVLGCECGVTSFFSSCYCDVCALTDPWNRKII